MPLNLKTPKEEVGARLNCPSAKSDGLVEKKVDGERNQDEDPGPSRPSCSSRQVSTVSNIEIGPGVGITQLLEEELEHIFGFLTFAEVKSVRLVNKHWRQVATTLLRRSSKQITVDGSVSECITKMGDGHFPVNRLNVRLVGDNYCYDLGNPEICSAFFPGICAWVKELTLSVDIDKPSAVQSLDEMPTFPTDCVYKELIHFNLKVDQTTDLFRESWERFTDFVRSILEKSPNLLEVNVEYEFSWVMDAERLVICPVIENLFPISNSVATSKLSYINFENVPLEKIDLAKWSTLNLKLRKLGLNVSCLSNTNNLLTKFLETQTGTLKDLSLKLVGWETEAPQSPFTFPRLEKLEQLRVICYSMYEPGTFADIDYARMFPCLKKLDLEENHANWRDFLGNDLLQPTDTVEELIFPRLLQHEGNRNLTPNPAVIACEVFTGLKKLEIYPDRLFTEAVYENMPNLEVLTLFNRFSDTYDDVITGLGTEVCSRFMGVMTEEWIEELQNAEGRSMARLQTRFNGRFCFSRLSLHVFKKMSSLKCLDLFRGRAALAEGYFAHDEHQIQFLEELRANFVVL